MSESTSSPSLLDMLRQRTTSNMQDEALRRASEFGAGMLASGSPNFFTMLGAGARAAREGDTSRMEELRRLAETERQQRALDIEEQRRRDEAEVARQRLEADAPYRAAQTEQARAMAEYYRQGGSGAGRLPPGTITPALRLRAEQQAANEAKVEFPDPPSSMPVSEARRTEIRTNRQRYIEGRLPQLLESLSAPAQVPVPATPAAPAAPAARIDARGNPIR